MNPVGELLQPEDICLDVDLSSKSQLFDKISEILARRHGLVREKVRESLVERERLGSTGLGHGVAIPHARMNNLQQAVGSFVRTRMPIPFDAPDDRPVTNILALLVPAEATDKHLQLMANAAGMFDDKTFRGRLRSCTQPREVKALFSEWPEAATSAASSEGGAASRGR
jgi:PTS system nitrogen regulatory IIA component